MKLLTKLVLKMSPNTLDCIKYWKIRCKIFDHIKRTLEDQLKRKNSRRRQLNQFKLFLKRIILLSVSRMKTTLKDERYSKVNTYREMTTASKLFFARDKDICIHGSKCNREGSWKDKHRCVKCHAGFVSRKWFQRSKHLREMKKKRITCWLLRQNK